MMKKEVDVDNHDTQENDDVDADVDVDDDNVGWHPYLRVSKRAGGGRTITRTQDLSTLP